MNEIKPEMMGQPQEAPTEVWQGSPEMSYQEFTAVINEFLPQMQEPEIQDFANLLNQQIPDWDEWDDDEFDEFMDDMEEAFAEQNDKEAGKTAPPMEGGQDKLAALKALGGGR